jgi:hypothetical protein
MGELEIVKHYATLPHETKEARQAQARRANKEKYFVKAMKKRMAKSHAMQRRLRDGREEF